MPPRRQPHVMGTSPVPYRSTAWRIGNHQTCAESSPTVAPVDLPVIYEVCDCPCHAAPDRAKPAEVQR